MCEEFQTEVEVIDILMTLALGTDKVAVVFAMQRVQSQNSLTRVVTFVIQTKVGNEALINSINKYRITHNVELRFIKSEMNVHGGSLDVDYLFIEAYISPNYKKVLL